MYEKTVFFFFFSNSLFEYELPLWFLSSYKSPNSTFMKIYLFLFIFIKKREIMPFICYYNIPTNGVLGVFLWINLTETKSRISLSKTPALAS